MEPISRKKRHFARTLRARGGALIDSLEARRLLAADSELRWMIAAAGGTPAPSAPLTVVENLSDVGGYPKTSNPSALTLTGTAGSGMFVKVNGVQATPSPAPEGWSLENTNNVLGLTPGINRVQVRSYDSQGEELVRKTLDVWYDDGSVQNIAAGTLSGNNTWTAAGGPYLVNADLTIPAGSSLTIEPGTSVYFAYQARLIVNGRLNAEGTDYKHIRFTRNPLTSSNWANLEFRNSTEDNKIAYADIEYAASTDGGTVDQHMRVDRAKIFLDHVHFDHGNRMYIDLTNASLDIRNSIFPSISSAELIHYLADGANMPANSFAIMDGNAFGPSTGYNDIIDYTGAQRPGSIPRFTNNWFLGGPDDGLDMDSTDAWIEGNVFMHFHQDANRDSKSHAVSTGHEYPVSNPGATSEITVVRNFFYDVDHAALLKSGAYGTFVNNTIVNVHTPDPNINATTAVINFYEVRGGPEGVAQWQGRGATLQGNIIQDASRLFEIPQPFPAGRPDLVRIVVDHSILPAGSGTVQAGANITFGPGVKFGDSLLTKVTNVTDPTIDFALQPKSPALGTGPNGVDMGAVIGAGVTLSGEPASPTNDDDVTLNVGFVYGTGTNAAGYTHYKYRVNDGPWSAETPTGTPITLSDLADGDYTIYAIGKNDAGFWQSESAATASKTFRVDTVSPEVLGATFDRNAAAHSIAVGFSESVAAGSSLTPSDLVLTNQATGARVDDFQFAWLAQEKRVVLSFPTYPEARLPDGRYALRVSGTGVMDAAGNLLDGNGDGIGGDDFAFNFLFMGGDADGDGAVGFSDLVVLAQNYGQSGKTFDEGDFTYDGSVGFEDLVLLAQKYGTALPEAPARGAVAGVALANDGEVLSGTRASKGRGFNDTVPVRRPAPAAKARRVSK